MGGVFMDADAYAPVTLPQLRDLVVLKRKIQTMVITVYSYQTVKVNLTYIKRQMMFYVFSKELKVG